MPPEKPDRDLLIALQRGVPLERRPWAALARTLGLTEAGVLRTVRELFESGVARRFGAVFDAQSLGYRSTLCAADVPESALEAAVARITPHPGITHCYQRDGHPNLWFTLTAPDGELDGELARVAGTLGGYAVLNLPALRKFKVEAVFGQSEDGPLRPRGPVSAPTGLPAAPLAEREREVVRRLQANIAVTEDPFGRLASELGYAPGDLLALLKGWETAGVIRRIAFVMRHRQLGFLANSMCVWSVPAVRIEAAGVSMARSPHVTHCYERPAFPSFPYNLYAMIHAKTREQAVGIFERLGLDAGLSGGRMLWSVREFKKTSPVFFCEPPPALGKSVSI